MTCIDSIPQANIGPELFLQILQRLGLLEAFDQVPFHIQQRKSGLTSGARSLCLLLSQAHGCRNLTDWQGALREDSRIQHWLNTPRPKLPHASTLSRSLAATDARTVQALQAILRDSVQPLLQGLPTDQLCLLDVDNKGIPAEGKSYPNTGIGHMPDGSLGVGYRLHSLSWENRWALEMSLTPANQEVVGEAIGLLQQALRWLPKALRDVLVIRGDSAHGCRRFVRWLQRAVLGYLLKANQSATAQRLWRHSQDQPTGRLVRTGQRDLLVRDLGPTTLYGKTRGSHRRSFQVPRVVLYHEDPASPAPADKAPACFALLTTLESWRYAPAALLDLYNQRGGAVENLFGQLEGAFQISHLRSRQFWGNYTSLLLSLLAGNLTQWIRQEALERDWPVPAGVAETLQAARHSGLCLRQSSPAGCTLEQRGAWEDPYRETFRQLLTVCCQRLLRWTG